MNDSSAPDECTMHLTMGVCNRGTPGCSKEHKAAPDVERLIERLRQFRLPVDVAGSRMEWDRDWPLDRIMVEAADALSAAHTREAALREELAGEIRAGDLHRGLNRRTAEALGKSSIGPESSWHDMPEIVAALRAENEQLREVLPELRRRWRQWCSSSRPQGYNPVYGEWSDPSDQCLERKLYAALDHGKEPTRGD